MAYFSKISGPLLDRIDIQIWLQPLGFDMLTANSVSESSAAIRKRVTAAREFARKRLGADSVRIFCNAQLSAADIGKYCKMTDAAGALLRAAYDRMGMSVRGYDRIMRVARTIADLDKSEIIDAKHIAEAIQYRSLDKKYWG